MTALSSASKDGNIPDKVIFCIFILHCTILTATFVSQASSLGLRVQVDSIWCIGAFRDSVVGDMWEKLRSRGYAMKDWKAIFPVLEA